MEKFPVPKPRLQQSSDCAKKPIPLPRQRLPPPETSPDKSSTAAAADQGSSTPNLNMSKSPEQAETRNQLKIKSDGVKLVKTFVPKSLSVIVAPPEEDEKLRRFERTHSLPSDDIFQAITFHSPLVRKTELNFDIENDDDDDDDEDVDQVVMVGSAPPPVYPPPPLPDESVYDEVQSVLSSHSSNYGSYYSPSVISDQNESVYEDVSSIMDTPKKNGPSRLSTRSESWSFHDQRAESANSSTSPSILSDLEATRFGSFDDIYEDDSSESSRKNSFSQEIYTNVEIVRQEEARHGPATQSIIFEFDPLFEKKNNPDEHIYGKINRIASSPPKIQEKPPVPPRRFDSIADTQTIEEENEVVGSSPEPENNTQETGPPKGRRALMRWESVKRAMRRVADSPHLVRRARPQIESVNSQPVETTRETVEKPRLYQTSAPYSGILYKNAVGLERHKDYVPRWCTLSEGKLTLYQDKTSLNVKELIPLDKILSIHVMRDFKARLDGEELPCLEVTIRGRTYVLAAPSPSERRSWAQRLLDSMTPTFPARLATDYTRAGWSFLREGISGVWTPAWILLHQRTIFYCLGSGSLKELDLRKARCITLQECETNTSVSVEEKGPQILVDFPGQAVYMLMACARETSNWRQAIRAAALDNGANLAQQQLTRDDVPTIVDKCINFVYAHGSLSEGIYRRSAANTHISKLLTMFGQDAWAVQLTRNDYTEYDVASVLKRFFRDLPESLLTSELYPQLRDIVEGRIGECLNKEEAYKRALEQLPPINFVTARKLLGHLHFIHEQREHNLMGVHNLAAIWGPTLMHLEMRWSMARQKSCGGIDSLDTSKTEAQVVADLILLYPVLFEVDEAERNREKRMLEVLQKYHGANSNQPQSVKPSGDLKVWIYLNSSDSGQCVNVSIGPQKTAGNICTELCHRISLEAHQICVEEVILKGALFRPLHHTEKLLDVVLRWGYWDELDRRDNILVLKKISILNEIAPLAKGPMVQCGSLRYADSRTKSFRACQFELSQAKLCCYKDPRGTVSIAEWKIEDIVWYFGHEQRRNPHMRWSITFIDRKSKIKRSKDQPYFGCTIAGTSKEEQNQWAAAMLIAQYPLGILPQPTLID